MGIRCVSGSRALKQQAGRDLGKGGGLDAEVRERKEILDLDLPSFLAVFHVSWPSPSSVSVSIHPTCGGAACLVFSAIA